MIKIFFTIAIRNLFKNKFQSFLNIICLAIGIASLLTIFFYIKFELSYDKFNKNADKVFRVEYDMFNKNGSHLGITYHTPPLGPALKAQYPEVMDYTRILVGSTPVVIAYKEKKNSVKAKNICWVDAPFLTIFDCSMLKGNKKNALAEPNTIVLTESIAKIYFENEDPINKSITIDGAVYKVTGICEDAPLNAHFHYKYLLSYRTFARRFGQENWNQGNSLYVYVILNPGVNSVALENKMVELYQKHMASANKDILKFEYKLRPITDIHLHCHSGIQLEKNGDIKQIWFLSIVAIFILLISLVNAINLAISKSLERAKEVGVRKVVGGKKALLIYQFLTEYLLINVIAMIIAIIIFVISPMFLKTVFLNYNFSPVEILKDSWTWILILILLIVSVVISGLYPAFILSSYKPLSVLRGKLSTSSKGIIIRKSLIVFQFIITIALIAGVITIQKQLTYMQSQNLGFNINQILIVNGPRLEADSTYLSSLASFKKELLKYNKINSLSISSEIPGKKPTTTWGINPTDMPMKEWVSVDLFSCDYSFLDVYGMKIVAGRNFNKSFGSDNWRGFIITESVSKDLNFKKPDDAIDKEISFIHSPLKFKVVGVIADYNQLSLNNDFTPIGILFNDRVRDYISISLNITDVKNTILIIKNLWEKTFPKEPFNYYFLDDFFNQQYIDDMQFRNLINFFTIITIIITCAGLWAMSAHTISLRTKEIAVRKVLNAGTLDIVLLLFNYFYFLIMIAIVISLPIAYNIFNKWLNNYAFKIKIGIWFFIIPIIVITMFLILIIGYNIIKAIRTKPAESLKME